ncbi:D-serine ammonia-lyase [Marinomonas transparens]|uniref:Probable D-serine dehydratase n=1 Tax=Marinomonas transparens TaxID=2795388 RepID=A0A934JUV9_9GAMM|nr:D-serine ammonia-lyase [Marinomonas transparens]MBJ7538727.1 D-serine ammonia-lyase [Marinomonas transparens]
MSEFTTNPVVQSLVALNETTWFNPKKVAFESVQGQLPLQMSDMQDAADRLSRFAPYLALVFPDTAVNHGIIESELKPIPAMQSVLSDLMGADIEGRLLMKCDNQLPIAGSIKARGGIYEVLLHAERLALASGLLREGDDYRTFDSDAFRALFSAHQIVVGSTGNLGLSIGTMSAKLGFKVTVHMSADAREWKKALLESKGVNVVEHTADYSVAVEQGRQEAEQDDSAYFIDDEDSTSLFLGYSVAALRLQKQLNEQGILVDADHPLFVYLPCGVGGAPGGITFGLKQVFGDHVHCFFAEPTHSPCMLLGMETGLHSKIAVQDLGIDNLTCADGLAVGRPSAFVGPMMDQLLSGAYTVSDDNMHRYLTMLADAESIQVEPSATAGLVGVMRLLTSGRDYLKSHQLEDKMPQATHIMWATGGDLVPDEEREAYYSYGKALL